MSGIGGPNSIRDTANFSSLNRILEEGKKDDYVKPEQGGGFKIGYSTIAGQIKYSQLSDEPGTIGHGDDRELTSSPRMDHNFLTIRKLSDAFKGAAEGLLNAQVDKFVEQKGIPLDRFELTEPERQTLTERVLSDGGEQRIQTEAFNRTWHTFAKSGDDRIAPGNREALQAAVRAAIAEFCAGKGLDPDAFTFDGLTSEDHLALRQLIEEKQQPIVGNLSEPEIQHLQGKIDRKFNDLVKEHTDRTDEARVMKENTSRINFLIVQSIEKLMTNVAVRVGLETGLSIEGGPQHSGLGRVKLGVVEGLVPQVDRMTRWQVKDLLPKLDTLMNQAVIETNHVRQGL